MKYIFLLIFLFTQVIFAQEKFIIKGQILKSDGQPAASIPVVILRYNATLTPPLFPLERSTTNLQGEYIFEITSDVDLEYTIGMLLNDQRLNTDYFRYEGQQEKIINFQFPKSPQLETQPQPQLQQEQFHLKFSGRIISAVKDWHNVNTELYVLKYSINKNQEINVERIKTLELKENDEFSDFILVTPRTAYQIVFNFAGILIRSKPFSYESEKEMSIDLVINENVEDLQIERIVYILTQDQDRIKVSQINTLNNPTKNSIDTRKRNYIFPLSQQSYGHTLIPQAKQLTQFEDNQAKINQIFNQGNHRYIFEYFIDTYWLNQQITFPIPKKTKEIELLVLDKTIKMNKFNINKFIPAQFREIDNRRYYSMTINLTENSLQDENVLQFEISNLPLNKAYYFIISAFVVLLSIIALFFFIRGTNQPDSTES